MGKLKFMSAEELCNKPYTARDEIADLLSEASRLVREGNYDCAAWRLADAVFLFKKKIENDGLINLPGIHTKTGRGAILK